VEKFTTQLFYTQSIPMPNPIQGRSDGGGVYKYIYPPKIRPGKFLWSRNGVLMVIDLILHY